METDPENPSVFEPDMNVTYTIDVVAELTGLSSQTIQHYCEQGLIVPVTPSDAGQNPFTDDTLRILRRIEDIRATCEMNEAGLKLLLSLMNEIDRLRECLRDRR